MNCSVEKCERKKISRRGLCSLHHQRFLVHGESFDRSLASMRDTSKGSPIENFWAKVRLTANPEKCWEWQAALISTGYGNFVYHGKNWLAHRLSWFFVKGSEPTNFLLHSCDNPKCVNPNHLREGTQAENLQDMASKGRQWKQALKIQRIQEITI